MLWRNAATPRDRLRARVSLLLVVGQGPFEVSPTRALPGTRAFAQDAAPKGQIVLGFSQEPTVFNPHLLHIEVDEGIKGEQVVAVVGRLALLRGAPCAIQVDNGPEFVSKALDRWAYENGVTLDFLRLASRPTTCWSSRSTAAPPTSH